ncbi:hypothetical protein DENSPDRAFT_515814 [Dentipellis sp. KUC8613]|nr:hypothetical protein DENSPDRAFT_515814 [Dentipellis sp. KUC8613]
MSSALLDSANSGLLTGGMPTTSQDDVPSIVFIALYAATSLLAAIRLIQYRGTPFFRTYIRIMAFEAIRLVTFIIRIVAAINYSNALKGKGSFNQGYIIAEQIFLGIGFVVPTSTIVGLVETHSSRRDGETGEKKMLFRIMDLALLGAVILGIVAGASFSSALNNDSDLHKIKVERTVSAVATMVVLILLVAYSFHLAKHPRLPRSTTVWLGITAALLLIVPVYRIVIIADPPSNSQAISSKIVFYVFQISFEWIVGLSLLVFNAIAVCAPTPAGSRNWSNQSVSAEEAYGLFTPKHQYQ